MALSKRTYVGGTTKITAANLNDIQDSIIALEGKGITKEEVIDALEYTPAKASDIPTSLKNPNALKFTGGASGNSFPMNTDIGTIDTETDIICMIIEW